MNLTDEIATVAFGVAFVALLGHFGSDLSVTGKRLMLRKGPLWIGLRWVGGTLWALSFLLSEQGRLGISILGLAGALALLLGVTRKIEASKSEKASVGSV